MNTVVFKDGERKPVVRWIAGVTPFQNLSEECEGLGREKGGQEENQRPRDPEYGHQG